MASRIFSMQDLWIEIVITNYLSMLYFIYLFSNMISLGMGIWLAMCHAEILRDQENHMHRNQEKGVSDEMRVASSELRVANDEERVMTDTDILPLTACPSSLTPNPSPETLKQVDHPTPSVTKPLLFGEMTEQLVAMIQDDDSVEFRSIVEQLQEIHDMATSADESCYASEDAESFLTPEEEQYATTAICRPKVGRKKTAAGNGA